ncbi:hypothetical protein F5B17DRAFT_187234 [Nemania serpens]|nr:hypothetical protein F5B17DRAFT_187234 [Nemania serpens]
MASDTNGGTAGAGQPSDPYNNRLDKFTLFPRLPGEARIMIWKFAMEEPRLVHLRVEGCGIKRARRRGCPRGGGPYLTIDGERYEQVPPFFFVSREARFYALTIYTIRFSVAEQYRDPENQVAPYHFDTNLIMSPNDILVSWHVPELRKKSGYRIKFGDQASLVRNVMTRPWCTPPEQYGYTYFDMMLELLKKLKSRLRNKHSLEKAFILSENVSGPIKYVSSRQIVLDTHHASRRLFNDSGPAKVPWIRPEFPEWWLLVGGTKPTPRKPKD